jgi:hypothetical protein
MAETDPKADLHRYLRSSRQALLWKLNGLSEYDIRRPVVPTGTNLLGLVKHLALVEVGYFGDTFDRPAEELSFNDSEPNADMFAKADESREYITNYYQEACAHADATIEALTLDAVGHVPWWPPEHNEVTLHRVLVHVLAETNRHAGHADILRELIDGATGLTAERPNVPSEDETWWADYRERVEQAARDAADISGDRPAS